MKNKGINWCKREKQTAMVCLLIFFAFMMISVVTFRINAVDRDFTPKAKVYESQTDNQYHFSENDKKDKLTYNENGIGLGYLTISGDITKRDEVKGVLAYSTLNNVIFSYTYNGEYQDHSTVFSKDKNWHLVEDEGETIDGTTLSSSVGMGAIIIEKSQDGVKWESVFKMQDYFKDRESGKNTLYTVEEQSLKGSQYYRVTLVYKMSRTPKLFSNENMWFKEEYELFLSTDNNYVQINDITNYKQIKNNGTCKIGFSVNKDGSDCTVNIDAPDGSKHKNIAEGRVFTDAGKYKVEVVTRGGKTYTSNVSVTNEINISAACEPTVYETDGGFSNGKNLQEANTVFGQKSLSHLKIAVTKQDDSYVKASKDGTKFGVVADGIWIFMHLDYDKIENGKCSLSSIEAGDKIHDVQIGKIGTGAVIVQKSVDGGKKWTTVPRGEYGSDLKQSLHGAQDIMLYSPDGNEVIDGVTLRITYIYQIRERDSFLSSKIKNYMEEYEIFLCNGSLEAITFHNKTLESEQIDPTEENGKSTEVKRLSETLKDGSLTFSGFEIDNSLNRAAAIRVYFNGEQIDTDRLVFTETGKYDIYLESPIGDKTHTTIYVDHETAEEIYRRYFGESFITGKHIYDEDSDRPVFEGGKTQYHLLNVGNYCFPISGCVLNTVSNKKTEVEPVSKDTEFPLIDPGTYEIKLSLNGGEDSCGDSICFTFRFKIIKEGEAPGPRVNYEKLIEYSHMNVSDACSIYYGVSHKSLGKGLITYAFSTREDALRCAMDYETRMVEDGLYYSSGRVHKEKYENGFDLADAVVENAKQSVEVLCFVMNRAKEYTTLSKTIADAFPYAEVLMLDSSIVLFGEEQMGKMTSFNEYPLISPKPYRYYDLSEEQIESLIGETERKLTKENIEEGFQDFQFIKDENGYDSSTVTIIDCNGNEYSIEYGVGVGMQLQEQQCPSGIVTIYEENIYGDAHAPYYAIFIRQDENTSVLDLTYILDGEETNVTVSQNEIPERIVADSFYISGLTDELDIFALVLIEREGDNEEGGRIVQQYNPGKTEMDYFAEPGNYIIECVNRLGYSFKFPITVKGNNEYVLNISFTGDGTEDLPIKTVYLGQKNVSLGQPKERFGYNFSGYQDEKGTAYGSEIDLIRAKGELVLEAIWEAKKVKVHFVDSENNRIAEDIEVEFGSEFELPKPQLKEDQEFVSWTVDGISIDKPYYLISKEDDLIITADTKTKEAETEADTEAETEAETDEETEAETEAETESAGTESSETTAQGNEKDGDKLKELLKSVTPYCVGGAAVLVVTMLIVIISKAKEKRKKEQK